MLVELDGFKVWGGEQQRWGGRGNRAGNSVLHGASERPGLAGGCGRPLPCGLIMHANRSCSHVSRPAPTPCPRLHAGTERQPPSTPKPPTHTGHGGHHRGGRHKLRRGAGQGTGAARPVRAGSKGWVGAAARGASVQRGEGHEIEEQRSGMHLPRPLHPSLPHGLQSTISLANHGCTGNLTFVPPLSSPCLAFSKHPCNPPALTGTSWCPTRTWRAASPSWRHTWPRSPRGAAGAGGVRRGRGNGRGWCGTLARVCALARPLRRNPPGTPPEPLRSPFASTFREHTFNTLPYPCGVPLPLRSS